MSTLTDEVYEARLRMLRNEIAILKRQRDHWRTKFFRYAKILFAEQKEFEQDDERELNQEGEENASERQTVI